ncbi:cupin domain-containing protein [Heliobacterium undosum]|uniref:Cupin domain-containing protein n=1 Tax=Heliomicrobium undosum TaxID=121734 RepID=A0A845L4U4_9FIRM|nr:cupin domain-containing protein [Heliomicrobium undosum]MZP30065.1 cupin domain-containing protein [Heliomicrobium undosum]
MSINGSGEKEWGKRIHLPGMERSGASLPWNRHPVYPGVEMKHLITAQDTEGKCSAHLVRVAPGSEIVEHIHAGKWELHEVVAGSGICFIGNEEIAYEAGVCAVIPEDLPHKVRAEKGELIIRATFFPALC